MGASFSKEAAFERARFFEGALFRGAHFGSDAALGQAEFDGRAYFDELKDATNLGKRTIFEGIAEFNGARFKSDADFRKVVFKRESRHFSVRTFNEKFRFSRSEFSGRMDFDQAKFYKFPPQFYGAKLSEDASWDGVHWPWEHLTLEVARTHLRAYRQLKLQMDLHKKLHDEQMFHRYELVCREALSGQPEKTLSGVYRYFSGYGWSLKRPSFCLLMTVLTGWVTCSCSSGPYFDCALDAPWDGLLRSLSNTFRFWELGFPSGKRASVFRGVAVLQMLLGPLFLFLLLLAIRNRYRDQNKIWLQRKFNGCTQQHPWTFADLTKQWTWLLHLRRRPPIVVRLCSHRVSSWRKADAGGPANRPWL